MTKPFYCKPTRLPTDPMTDSFAVRSKSFLPEMRAANISNIL